MAPAPQEERSCGLMPHHENVSAPTATTTTDFFAISWNAAGPSSALFFRYVLMPLVPIPHIKMPLQGTSLECRSCCPRIHEGRRHEDETTLAVFEEKVV